MAETGRTDRLKIVVLGAGAGGGVPQWNCNCDVCRAARAGEVLSRTQSSLAVSADGEHWCLLNCSPDIRQQILATPCLHPRNPSSAGRRDSPVQSAVLTNGDVDHIAGLLVLRERQPFRLIATRAILQVLDDNPIFNVLDPACVAREELAFGADTEIAPGLIARAFPVPGKVALFLEDEVRNAGGRLETGVESGHTVGLEIAATGSPRRLFYIPGCAGVTEGLKGRMRGADLVLFDGTVWDDGEMIAHGLGRKTGRRMGHIAMAGAGGSLAAFEGLEVKRKVFVHINNTNPVLFENSPERRIAESYGWEIAWDGMELEL